MVAKATRLSNAVELRNASTKSAKYNTSIAMNGGVSILDLKESTAFLMNKWETAENKLGKSYSYDRFEYAQKRIVDGKKFSIVIDSSFSESRLSNDYMMIEELIKLLVTSGSFSQSNLYELKGVLVSNSVATNLLKLGEEIKKVDDLEKYVDKGVIRDFVDYWVSEVYENKVKGASNLSIIDLRLSEIAQRAHYARSPKPTKKTKGATRVYYASNSSNMAISLKLVAQLANSLIPKSIAAKTRIISITRSGGFFDSHTNTTLDYNLQTLMEMNTGRSTRGVISGITSRALIQKNMSIIQVEENYLKFINSGIFNAANKEDWQMFDPGKDKRATGIYRPLKNETPLRKWELPEGVKIQNDY